jgi:RNA polymerase sigma factor (sigma-70 family)
MARLARWPVPVGDVTELLGKASAGDRQAQDELYRRTEPELRKLARHWIRRYRAGGQVSTTEVIDGAFLKLMRISAPGWGHRGHFYKFASRNLHTLVIDELRWLRRWRATDLPDGNDLDRMPARDGGLTLYTLLALRDALEDLGRHISGTHREVVELIVFGECTLDQVAMLLRISRDTARRMRIVALEYLREKLGPSFPDLSHSPNGASGG